jgi:hypothetical protein
MMNKSMSKILLLFFQLMVLCAFAQVPHCAFDSMDSLHRDSTRKYFEQSLQNRQKRPTRTTETEIFKIPVVVHVVHNNQTDQIGLGNNISDEQIFSAIAVLNEDFRRKNADTINTPTWARPVAADMQIEFFLATIDPNGNATNGITRHRTTKASFNIGIDGETELKSHGYWPNDQYMNIWVSPLSGGYIGYAQFPNGSSLADLGGNNGSNLTDGIVIVPHAFGRLTGKANGVNNPYRYGRTAVHEIGHWLGLLHTFGSGEGDCNYTDYCEDTPKQDVENLGLSDCDTTIISSCATVVMHSNFMDYTNDACMNIYTQDQKNRVWAVLESSPARAALKYSKALCGLSANLTLPFYEDFKDESKQGKNWELFSSNPANEWTLTSKGLEANFGGENPDSMVLKTGVFKYEANKENILRFKQKNSVEGDSVAIYYEFSCSEELVLFKKIALNTTNTETILNFSGLGQNGLIRFYFVFTGSVEKQISIQDFAIYEQTKTMSVVVYPNPNDGKVNYNVSMEKEQELAVYVFDIQGKKVFEDINQRYSGVYSLDLSFLKSGSYFLKFLANGQVISKQIFIY